MNTGRGPRANRDDALTPEQQSKIERVQFVAVIVLAMSTVGLPLLEKVHVLSTWVAVGSLALVLFVVVVVGTWLVAGIEGIPYRELHDRTFREMKDDGLARVRRVVRRLRRPTRK